MPKIKIKNSHFKNHLHASLLPKFTAELYPVSEKRMGGGKGKWSRTAVFSINSCTKPPTSPTASSTPPAKRRQEAACEIPFLQGGSSWLPSFLNAPILARGSLSFTREHEVIRLKFCLCFLPCWLPCWWSPRGFSLPPIHPHPNFHPHPGMPEAHVALWQKQQTKRWEFLVPSGNMLELLPTKRHSCCQPAPCFETSFLQAQQLVSLLFWSPERKGIWDTGGAAVVRPSSAGWKALIC